MSPKLKYALIFAAGSLAATLITYYIVEISGFIAGGLAVAAYQKHKEGDNLKSIGIKKVQELGRVTIPKEVRDTLDIDEGDAIEMYVDGNRMILQKYLPGCVFCGHVHKTIEHGGLVVCLDCIKQLQKQVALDKAMSKR